MVKIRMKPNWGFKYQELHTYFKLNHKILVQLKPVRLIWALIWTLNGIISILVINYSIIHMVKL
jgi:hypothetical protein